jgi:hypothetical protein
MNTNKKENIVLFTNESGNVELRADTERDTIWASLDQISQLFDRDKSVISRHFRNIFKDAELDRNSVVAKNATTATDGKTYIVEYYNLDAILSVGYRVNSNKATQFRIWATGILREYLIKGFGLNQRKLASSLKKFDDLHKAIDFIESKSDKPLKAKITVRLTKDLLP